MIYFENKIVNMKGRAMMKEYEVKYNEWLNNPVIDEESKK